MNWRERFRTIISSADIKPEIGMKVKTLKKIDGKTTVIGEKGTIITIRNDNSVIGVHYDNNGVGDWGDDRRYWDATITEWNNGSFEVLK